MGNSPWSASYRELWTTELTVGIPGHGLTEDLRHWVHDRLMTLFFFVIGLEIKQELTNGQLTSDKEAAVPAAGALGGMMVPALLYLALNPGGDGAAGWVSPWPPTWPSCSLPPAAAALPLLTVPACPLSNDATHGLHGQLEDDGRDRQRR